MDQLKNRPPGQILRKAGDNSDILAAYFEVEKLEVFHLKNLYEFMYEYLMEEGWVDAIDYDDNRVEHFYVERRYQGGGLEHRVWWRLQRKPFRDNNYFRYVMLINFRNVAGKKLEVVHKGQKVGTFQGDLTVNVESYVQIDYDNKWRNHWLLKHFDKLFQNRVYKGAKDTHEQQLWRETYRFAALIKEFIEMKVPFEHPTNFWPIRGMGPNPGTPPAPQPQEKK